MCKEKSFPMDLNDWLRSDVFLFLNTIKNQNWITAINQIIFAIEFYKVG